MRGLLVSTSLVSLLVAAPAIAQQTAGSQVPPPADSQTPLIHPRPRPNRRVPTSSSPAFARR